MKSILITGASSGIGAATGRRFLEAGWRVGLMARREAELREVAAGHSGALVLPGDTTRAEDLEAAVAELADASAGRLDAVFANAGAFGPTGPIDEIDPAAWRALIDVNVTGVFLAARAAFGQMRRQDPQGGRIILNGSLSAHAPRGPGTAAYTTSKHAITGLTRSLSMDGRPYDIACGQIDIGNAGTPMVNEAAAREGSDMPVMDVEHCADAVFRMAALPLSANIQFMTIMATKMPFVGRG